MQLAAKIGIGSGATFVVILIFGWMAFPALLKNMIKKNVALKEGGDIRNMWTKVPFPIDFKVYMFNVTNARDVSNGDSPVLDEIGPFFFEEWKEKVNMSDNEADDTVSYNPKTRFIFSPENSGKLTMDEMITIPHPFLASMVLAVNREKPAMLTLLNKALNVIFQKPETLFVTASVREILFDGLLINCSVTDFGAKAVCTQIKTQAKDLDRVGEDGFLFSFFGMKNKTLEGRFKVKRGIKNSHDLGRVLEYEDKKQMDIWGSKECNQYHGTDSTIFPPFLKREEGLWSYAPDLCRSLGAYYTGSTTYDNIPVDIYKADLGDQTANKEDKCFCATPTTCLKKGVMDLTKCVGAPIMVSLPHFYNCDESYQSMVRGLHPNENEHGIKILFESMTGTPVAARKRLQFSLPIEPIAKVSFMKTLPEALLPIMWVEEGLELNSTFTHQLDATLFRTMRIMKVVKWLILSFSLVGMGVAAFFHFHKRNNFTINPNVAAAIPKTFGASDKNEQRKSSIISSINGNNMDRY